MRTHTKESQQNMTPEKAMQYLKEGNERFVQNLKAHRDHLEQVNETREGQYPFATILSCIDSRVSAELIFDQGLGDIFSIRIAGNILNEDIVGSMEFACKIAGSKLIVVLGHTRCGAVNGAVKDVKMGSLSGLLAKIKPAIETVESKAEHDHGSDPYLDEVVEQNVQNVAKEILERSPILKDMVESGEIDIAKGVYSVDTGMVEFC
ncbi:MAG: carbonic anhydrase [Cyclobacteriaceae bacterium]|nr:carbonic anhydrase [Cyclobacteriaceae bacterium]